MPKPLLLLTSKTLGHGILALGGIGVLATVDFNGEITLGSILIAVVIAAMAAFYTLRSKIAEVWRQEAEGEKARANRLQEELDLERKERAEDAHQQQELRHNLKDEMAGLKGQVEALKARTDLTAALEAISEMNRQTTEAIIGAMNTGATNSEARDHATHHLLEEIRDKLPSEPIVVVREEDVESHRASRAVPRDDQDR